MLNARLLSLSFIGISSSIAKSLVSVVLCVWQTDDALTCESHGEDVKIL